ncbi:Lipid storage droplets surface-binding protein 2 [Gryllus bimaculatus]|nr:Lipid storage droplets surface-binding protein 2 [Gryllus bimaculatus]
MKTPSEDVPAAAAEPQPEQTCPCEPPALPNIECVDRVKRLPIVEAAWNQSTAIYNNVKGYSPVLTWTLDTAEATVNKAVEQTLPVVAPIVKKLETPIGMVDKTLCKGLDVVENAVPCIKQEPAQIAENAKSLYDPACQQVKSLQELSWITANQFLHTNVGHAIIGGVDNLSSTVDRILDFILPPGEPLGFPRAEKVMQALQTIGGLPHRAARHGYATICNIIQVAGQQDVRENLRAILTLLHIQNLSSSLSSENTSTSMASPSTSSSNDSPPVKPPAQLQEVH